MNIIEIVFEDVPSTELMLLFCNLAGEKHINESVLSELDSTQVYYRSLPVLACSNFTLTKPSIRIIKYNGKFDLELSFDLNQQSLLSNNILSAFFTETAQKYGVKQVYGGMEPACDEDTRIFTGSELGPIILGAAK